MIAFLVTLAIAWGTNGLPLDTTAVATGWPLLIGTTGVLALLGVLLRYRRATHDWDPKRSPGLLASDERE